MANEQNLRVPTSEEARENGRKGGIRSGEVRREKAMMKQELEMMLKSMASDNETYKNKVTLGLLANAIDKTKGGSPEAYKTIVSMLGELDTRETEAPSLNINITDNSKLEKVLYDEED